MVEEDGDFKPDISVVIPLYNKEEFIARAIRSVLGQSYESFELIIIDDGSTDNSYDVARNFSDPRVVILRQENKGEGQARNSGIDHARGKIVAFLDADDIWTPDHLKTIYDLYCAFPSAGLFSTKITHARIGNDEVDLPVLTDRLAIIDYFKESVTNLAIVSSSSAAMNLSVIGNDAFFKTYKFAADTECWMRIASKHNVAVADKVTAIYFQGVGGVMDGLTREGGFFRREIGSLLEASPKLHHGWELHKKFPKDKSIRRFSENATFRFVRGALYWGEYENALKVSTWAAEYSFKFRVLAFLMKRKILFGKTISIIRIVKVRFWNMRQL